MKKLLIFFAVVFLTVPVGLLAQTADSTSFLRKKGRRVAIRTVDRDSMKIDSMPRLDAMDNDLVQLRDGGKEGGIVLEVAGFGLTLDRTPMQKMKNKPPKIWFTALSDMEFGFTQLTGYDSSQKDFLDQRLGASFHFSIPVFQVCFALNRSQTLSLALGFQYTIDNFRLTNNRITVGNVDGLLVPIALDTPADKSKIVTSSLGIPVRLNYTPVKHLRLSAVAYSDFSLGADAIVKRPKQKTTLSGFRTYQFGVGASASYYGLGMYVRYGVTPLFQSGVGPDCHTLSFGIAYSLHL